MRYFALIPLICIFCAFWQSPSTLLSSPKIIIPTHTQEKFLHKKKSVIKVGRPVYCKEVPRIMYNSEIRRIAKLALLNNKSLIISKEIYKAANFNASSHPNIYYNEYIPLNKYRIDGSGMFYTLEEIERIFNLQAFS